MQNTGRFVSKRHSSGVLPVGEGRLQFDSRTIVQAKRVSDLGASSNAKDHGCEHDREEYIDADTRYIADRDWIHKIWDDSIRRLTRRSLGWIQTLETGHNGLAKAREVVTTGNGRDGDSEAS